MDNTAQTTQPAARDHGPRLHPAASREAGASRAPRTRPSRVPFHAGGRGGGRPGPVALGVESGPALLLPGTLREGRGDRGARWLVCVYSPGPPRTRGVRSGGSPLLTNTRKHNLKVLRAGPKSTVSWERGHGRGTPGVLGVRRLVSNGLPHQGLASSPPPFVFGQHLGPFRWSDTLGNK